jgi:hypothetical protein
LIFLARQLRRSIADSLEVIDKLGALFDAALGLRDTEKETRVHGYPAFTALRQRDRRSSHSADRHDLVED